MPVDLAVDRLRLLYAGAGGRPLETFAAVDAALRSGGQRLVLAMNAGMFHPGFQPVGWCVSDGREVTPLNLAEDAVNFHEFATLFRDGLHCPDALYLDGGISSLAVPGRALPGEDSGHS